MVRSNGPICDSRMLKVLRDGEPSLITLLRDFLDPNNTEGSGALLDPSEVNRIRQELGQRETGLDPKEFEVLRKIIVDCGPEQFVDGAHFQYMQHLITTHPGISPAPLLALSAAPALKYNTPPVQTPRTIPGGGRLLQFPSQGGKTPPGVGVGAVAGFVLIGVAEVWIHTILPRWKEEKQSIAFAEKNAEAISHLADETVGHHNGRYANWDEFKILALRIGREFGLSANASQRVCLLWSAARIQENPLADPRRHVGPNTGVVIQIDPENPLPPDPRMVRMSAAPDTAVSGSDVPLLDDPLFDAIDRQRHHREKHGRYNLEELTPAMIVRMTPEEQAAVAWQCFETYREASRELVDDITREEDLQRWKDSLNTFREKTGAIEPLDKFGSGARPSPLYEIIFAALRQMRSISMFAELALVRIPQGKKTLEEARTEIQQSTGIQSLKGPYGHTKLGVPVGLHEFANNVTRVVEKNYGKIEEVPGGWRMSEPKHDTFQPAYGMPLTFTGSPWSAIDLPLGFQLKKLGWQDKVEMIDGKRMWTILVNPKHLAQ